MFEEKHCLEIKIQQNLGELRINAYLCTRI